MDSLSPRRSPRDLILLVAAGLLVVVTLWVMKGSWRLFSLEGPDNHFSSTETLKEDDSGVVCNDHASSTDPIFTDPAVTVSPEDDIPFVPTTTSSAIRLLFVGDIMLDRNVANRSRAAHDLGYPFAKLPPDWLASFDYTIGNLEGPITSMRRPPEKSIDFQFDPAMVPILQTQGFDAFSQANNHALDQGAQGYLDSVQALRKQGFLVFGHQVQDDVIAMATTTIKGKRFAFVGWNTTDNPIDLEAAAKVLTTAKAQSDYVIAFMHWGAEYQDHPLSSVVDLSHWLIEHGVDVVIGGHPHWVQGINQFQGHPIAYSLGNFVFDQDFSAQTTEGLAVALTFSEQGVELEPMPLSIQKSQPRLLEGQAKIKRLESLAGISGPDLREQIKMGRAVFPR
jgi:poly-gamma-glutamate synthesis protein (capsule biosynthesis protein)